MANKEQPIDNTKSLATIGDALSGVSQSLSDGFKSLGGIMQTSMGGMMTGLKDIGSVFESTFSSSPILFAVYNILKNSITDSLKMMGMILFGNRSASKAEELSADRDVEIADEAESNETTREEGRKHNLTSQLQQLKDMNENSVTQLSYLEAIVDAVGGIVKRPVGPTQEEKRERAIAQAKSLEVQQNIVEGLSNLDLSVDEEIGGVGGVFKRIAERFTSTFASLASFFGLKSFAGAAGGFLTSMFSRMTGLLKFLGKTALRAFGFAAMISGLFTGITDAWGEWKKTGEISKTLIAFARGFIKGITFGLIDDAMLDKIQSKIGEGIEVIINWFARIKPKLVEAITSAGDWVGEKFNGIKDAVVNWFNSVATVVQSKAAIAGDFIGEQVDKIKTAISEWFNQIKDFVQPIFDAIRTVKDNILIWINDVTGRVPGWDGLFKEEADEARLRQAKLTEAPTAAVQQTVLDIATGQLRAADKAEMQFMQMNNQVINAPRTGIVNITGGTTARPVHKSTDEFGMTNAY